MKRQKSIHQFFPSGKHPDRDVYPEGDLDRDSSSFFRAEVKEGSAAENRYDAEQWWQRNRMLLFLFDLDGAEVDGLFVGRPGKSSVEEGGDAEDDQNHTEYLHLPSRSSILIEMRTAAKGCKAGRGGSRGRSPPR